MSSHSRSSSEVLTLQYSDILRVFFKPFRDNFDFDDVKEFVKHLFTKDEYESINNEQNANHRLVLLFDILCGKESIIPKFLDNINQDYKFLADPIRDELKNPSKLTAIYMDKVHQLRSNFPKHADFNVLRVNMYVRLRDALRNLKRYHSVVLQGDLGTGKKWLTISVCYDYSVMKSMGFQIYWLDVSDCESPEQDLHRLQQLRLMLGDATASHSPTFMNGGGSNGFATVYHEKEHVKYNESILNRVFELQQCLRKHLIKPAHRNCLVILKDVKNFKTFQTFNLGCKLLVITRIRKIYESLSSKISTNLPIDSSLTLSEFYTLFEKYLSQSRDRFPKHAYDIYKYSDGNPYLLSIIAQNLQQKKSPWDEWIKNLQKFEIPNEKFSTIVELSLNVLNDELLSLYATLIVFPPSVLIPIKLLAFIWDKTLEDADHIVKRFNKYSFVSKEPCNIDEDVEDCEDCCCIIPLIYSSHLRGSKRMRSMINSINIHEKVIKYYNIEQVLLFTQRTEIDLCSSQHDQYFYSFIGYHLYEAGRSSLFPKLYLDFGFLEQKIRAVGLSNTISDLKYFEMEIINSDYRRQKLLAEIREFLPKIEEKLIESKDTSLLQYALMAIGEIYEEATIQIRLFPQRVWFMEHGNFHKRRQIVSLINQAKFIKFFDQDMCFIVLVNGNMLLLDISIDCPTKPILLKDNYDDHHHHHHHKESEIVEARLFDDHKFLLTLDIGGILKVWSLSDDNRRTIVYRRTSRQKANYYTMESNHKIQCKKSKQRIDVNSMGQPGFIVAFYIEQLPPNRYNETNLHIAFNDGDISVYEWNHDREEFKPKKIPILQTKAHDIRFFTKILNTYYMLLSKSGKISFWNLRDSSKAFVPFDWPQQTCGGPLTYEQSTFINDNDNDDDHKKTLTRAIFVFPDKVLSLIFEHKMFSSKPDGYVEILYENHWDMKSAITCAKLTDDQNYLVVGTKRGLIVYDLLAKSEVLRCNVSDAIACVDVYALDDNVFKYVIICGAEHRKALYIFAVRKHGENEITWAHNVTSMGNKMSTDPQLEPDVWLLGQMLYDIDYCDDGSLVLAAVDSKYRVHQVNTTTTDSWPIIIPRETSEPITSIAIGKELGFVGYGNGDIFNIKKDAFENEAMNEAIIYLKIIDDCHLIASTENQTLISNVGGANDGITCTYGFGTKQCYKIKQNCFLLISSAGVITLIEERANKYEQKFQMDGLRENVWDTYTLCGCDFQHDHLCLASANTVKVYYFAFYKDSPPRVRSIINSLIINPPQNQKISISCVALSKDASLTAIGYTNGNIEIYKVHDMPLDCLYRLQSHRTRIYDMKFSPGNEILVSCAEQLCFWNVLYILNNQLIKNSPKRHSSRFSSQRSYETTEEVDAKIISPHENHLNIHGKNGTTAAAEHGDDVILFDAVQRILVTNGIGHTANAWRDKQGPSDKPELLSCIKFDGRKAEKFFANPDFTQFNTIDDEGVYYHLILFNNNIESNPMDIAHLNIIDISAPRHFSLNNTDANSLGEDEVYV